METFQMKDIEMTAHLTDEFDTGEIVNLHQLDKARTEIIDLGDDATVNLAQRIADVRPRLRMANATGEYPALSAMPYGWVKPEPSWVPAEDAGLTLWGHAELERPPTGNPPPAPTPPPGKTMWSGPPLRPAVPLKPGRGRHRMSTTRRKWAFIGAGAVLLAEVAAIGVSLLLGVHW